MKTNLTLSYKGYKIVESHDCTQDLALGLRIVRVFLPWLDFLKFKEVSRISHWHIFTGNPVLYKLEVTSS